MLASLHIENIAIIKKLDVDFTEGFTVLTGETGAGKSILIDSIAFLLGAKAQRDLIRSGEEKALVSGYFVNLSDEVKAYLTSQDITLDEEDDSLTITKTMTSEGRVTVKINGRTVTSTVGRTCGMYLINIHGQHQNQILQNPQNHIIYLDRFAENDELLKAYHKEYQETVRIQHEIKRLSDSAQEKERRRDLLQYQINDIQSADLQANEEELLNTRKKLLQNAKLLQKHIVTVYRSLYKNPKSITAVQLLESAQDSLDKLSELLPEVTAYSEKIGTLAAEVEDIAKAIVGFMPSNAENPEAELEEINDRLDVIRKLKRKYGTTVEEILKYLENAQLQLSEIENSDNTLTLLTKEHELKQQILKKLADQLHEKRTECGNILSRGICDVLSYLDMNKVSFSVHIEQETEFSSNGYDTVEFYIATNPGEPMKPLTKIASGGELSRIMLAIKCVLANAEEVSTIIFDEVDTGVSGKTSQKIGFKLHDLARTTQIICITHAAQIAAVADQHYLISKSEDEGRMRTSLIQLDKEGRVDEIARIIGGINVTDQVRATAREMLNMHT